MKVVLNALFLDPGRSGGTETYLRELAPALRRVRPGLDLTIATTRRGADALRADGFADVARIDRYPVEERRPGLRPFAEQVLLPRRARGAVLHDLITGPVRPAGPSVVTLHDAIFLRLPGVPRLARTTLRRVIGGAARRADALIAVSASARDECCAAFGLDPARVTVVPHGAGRIPDVAPVPPEEMRRRLAVPPDARVVLCVAAVRPHKNQGLLAEALPLLPEDVWVVLAGAEEAYAERLRGADQLVLAGRVGDAELEGLWATASCAAFPTLAEGFGLPVLEAMRRGVPVACSDLPVLHEVGGDVPAYFDPDDARSAAAAIQTALGDPAQPDRGRARAAEFTWERTARATLAVYESVA